MSRFRPYIFLLAGLVGSLAPARSAAGPDEFDPSSIRVIRRASTRIEGKASWYGPGFYGRPTASGEVYGQTGLTAAHRTLPLGSIVKVINPENGRQVTVRINDRGPYVTGRILDLSPEAANLLGTRHVGVAPVRLEIPTTWYVQVGLFQGKARQDRAVEFQKWFRAVTGIRTRRVADGDSLSVRVGPLHSAKSAGEKMEALWRHFPAKEGNPVAMRN